MLRVFRPLLTLGRQATSLRLIRESQVGDRSTYELEAPEGGAAWRWGALVVEVSPNPAPGTAPVLHLRSPDTPDFFESTVFLPAFSGGQSSTILRFPRRPRKIVLEFRSRIPVRPTAVRFFPLHKAEAAFLMGCKDLGAAAQGSGEILGLLSHAYSFVYRGKPGTLGKTIHAASMNWFQAEAYARWLDLYDTIDESGREELRRKIAALPRRPKIAVWIAEGPGSSPGSSPGSGNDRTLSSLRAQPYPEWEVVTTPEALAAAEFVLVLNAGTEVSERALFALVEQAQAQAQDADIVYADQDRLDDAGVRREPEFKPDWSADLFLSGAGGSWGHALYRGALAAEILRARPGVLNSAGGGWLFFLEAWRRGADARIRHVAEVLFHTRDSRGWGAPLSAHREEVRAALQARGQEVEVLAEPHGLFRLKYPLPARLPKVSAVICTRDRVGLLKGSVGGLLERTDYAPLEVIIVDNGSTDPETLNYLFEIARDPRVKVIRHDAPFNFSELNNLAVAAATGEVLAILNNDLEMMEPDWLHEMVRQALRPGVGAVGAKLYYRTDTIQHAGVILGIGYGAGHIQRFLPRGAEGYLKRAAAVQDFSAVTAACLVMTRKVFDEVGGFDPVHFSVAFNDVDLCLRVRAKGYRVLWTPFAELYHLESASRKSDEEGANVARFRAEARSLHEKWKGVLFHDPFFNRNLTLCREDFSVGFPPRDARA